MLAGRRTLLLALLMGACAEPQRAGLEKTPQPETAEPTPAPAPAERAPAPAGRAQAPTAPSKPAAPRAAPSEPEAPLDLKSLVQRLQDTKAIGLFTKVALKNQVDDLLDQFRAFYEGRGKQTLEELRPAYDQLVMKVLALLQDADPALAKDIVASRERIWSFLADRSKFSTI